jgi:hypothetical protein
MQRHRDLELLVAAGRSVERDLAGANERLETLLDRVDREHLVQQIEVNGASSSGPATRVTVDDEDDEDLRDISLSFSSRNGPILAHVLASFNRAPSFQPIVLI